MLYKIFFMIIVTTMGCCAMYNGSDTLAILKEHMESLPAQEQVICLSRLAQPQSPLFYVDSNGIMWSHALALTEFPNATPNQEADETCRIHTKPYGIKAFFASLRAFMRSMCCNN
ncbi:hypothetical protein Noda2021_10760 [Candidatus Dependentiae bacterium Noda2021]|nr:hypothetical protein Noda2021_10760 [Candidatus Dependentiae bacterium Noda2021]